MLPLSQYHSTATGSFLWRVVLHLMHTAQMLESDLQSVEHMFEVLLRGKQELGMSGAGRAAGDLRKMSTIRRLAVRWKNFLLPPKVGVWQEGQGRSN